MRILPQASVAGAVRDRLKSRPLTDSCVATDIVSGLLAGYWLYQICFSRGMCIVYALQFLESYQSCAVLFIALGLVIDALCVLAF